MRSGRSYSRWKLSRPAITSRPAECSASSTTFAGFQFHMPPDPVPSKWREPSGPRSAISPQHLLGQLRLPLEHVAAPRMRLGEVPHPPAVHRVVLDRHEARFVRPVLEDLPVAHQLRHGRLGIGADARAERDAVAALDGRDRVELDAAEALHGCEHLGGRAFARARARSPAPRPRGGGSLRG